MRGRRGPARGVLLPRDPTALPLPSWHPQGRVCAPTLPMPPPAAACQSLPAPAWPPSPTRSVHHPAPQASGQLGRSGSRGELSALAHCHSNLWLQCHLALTLRALWAPNEGQARGPEQSHRPGPLPPPPAQHTSLPPPSGGCLLGASSHSSPTCPKVARMSAGTATGRGGSPVLSSADTPTAPTRRLLRHRRARRGLGNGRRPSAPHPAPGSAWPRTRPRAGGRRVRTDQQAEDRDLAE